MKIAQYVTAPNDVNGNPRRGWVIIDTQSTNQYYTKQIDFVDEGYQGDGALEEKYKGIRVCPGLDVTPKQYRDLKKEFKA